MNEEHHSHGGGEGEGRRRERGWSQSVGCRVGSATAVNIQVFQIETFSDIRGQEIEEVFRSGRRKFWLSTYRNYYKLFYGL
jgi:hypothetical protein